MNKKLYFMLTATVCALSSFAANSIGEYVYTPTAKVKVFGENILANGDFTDGTTGWTDSDGSDVDLSKWSVSANGGPNGENVIISLNKTGSELARTLTLQTGYSYLVSFDIRSDEEFTSTTVGTYNNMTFFLNNDAGYTSSSDGYTLLNICANVKSEWTTVSEVISVGEATHLQIVMKNITAGCQMTNFCVQQVSTVYDDRIVQRLMTYWKSIAASDEFAKANASGEAIGLDEFEMYLEALESAMNEVAILEDQATMNDYVSYVQQACEDYISKNTVDMADEFTGWEDVTAKKSKFTSIGDWVMTGDRWMHYSDDVNTVVYNYPAVYDLDRNDPSATLTTTMASGRYMVSFDLKGVYFTSGTKGETVLSYTIPFLGAVIYAGGDTVYCDTLSGTQYTTYTKFFDVAAGDNNIVVGTKYDLPFDLVGKKLGGYYYVSNFKLRLLGRNESDQKKDAAIEYIKDEQYALGVMIDICDSIYALNLPWERQALLDSIDAAREAYNASLSVIDAAGNFLGSDDMLRDATGDYTATPAYGDTLETYMNRLRSAKNAHLDTNEPYTNLKEDVEICQDVYDNTSLKGGSALKAALKSAIDEANTLIANVTSVTDSASFVDCDTRLMAAKAAYEASAAGWENPVNIDIVNGDFTDDAADTSTKSDANAITGWTYSAETPSKEYFKCIEDSLWDAGVYARVSRGSSASPQSKLSQAYTLTEGGIYEYRANAKAYNSNSAYDIYMATITGEERPDTVFDRSEVKLFFGENGSPDSARVHSRNYMYSGSTVYGGDIPSAYSLFYYVPSGQTAEVEFGISSYGQVNRQGACEYGFGDNRVIYYGNDLASFFTGLKDDLAEAVSAAEKIIADTLTDVSLLDDGRVFLVRRLAKAIEEAKSAGEKSAAEAADIVAAAKEIQNAKWTMIAAQNGISGAREDITGINGAGVTEPKITTESDGVYNLAGQYVGKGRYGLRNLTPGIYILGGKKIYIR